jgi:hypothetical protein
VGALAGRTGAPFPEGGSLRGAQGVDLSTPRFLVAPGPQDVVSRLHDACWQAGWLVASLFLDDKRGNTRDLPTESKLRPFLPAASSANGVSVPTL